MADAEVSHETCGALAPGKSVRLVMSMILETFCGVSISVSRLSAACECDEQLIGISKIPSWEGLRFGSALAPRP